MVKIVRSGLIFSALVILSAALAMAPVTVTHNETGLRFDLPDNWETDQDGNLLAAFAPDESVLLMFFVGKADNAAALLENIVDELDGIIGDPEITSDDVVEEEINGLLQVYIEGTGVRGGEAVDFDLTMVIGGKRNMSIVVLGDIDGWQDTVDEIYASIRN